MNKSFKGSKVDNIKHETYNYPRMTEQLTHYKFEIDTDNGIAIEELDVPFTQEEIKTLEQLDKIRASWAKIAGQGSGLVRELYLGLVDIPLEMTLASKEDALSLIHKTIGNIRMIREEYGKSGNRDYFLVANDLTRIETELLPFIPNMQVEDE